MSGYRDSATVDADKARIAELELDVEQLTEKLKAQKKRIPFWKVDPYEFPASLLQFVSVLAIIVVVGLFVIVAGRVSWLWIDSKFPALTCEPVKAEAPKSDSVKQ